MPTLADISRLSTEEAAQLLHGAIHEMCGAAGQYAPAARPLVVQYQSLFQRATAEGMGAEEVQAAAEAGGVGARLASPLPPTRRRAPRQPSRLTSAAYAAAAAEYATVVASTFHSRKLDLSKAMRDATSAIAPAHLKDFDWKVQVMLSSDKISEIRQPVLSLKLTTESAPGDTKDVVVEMTKEEADRVLRSMEAANEVRAPG